MKISLFTILAFLFLLTPTLLPAQTVEFFDGTWEEVNEKAEKEGKYILMDAYTDWCYWCKVMEKKTFNDPKVADFVNAHFVATRFDFETGQGVDLAMKFRVLSYPTILLFNSAGQLVHKNPGYIEDNQEFIKMLQKGLDLKQERVFGFDSKLLDLPYPEFLLGIYAANGKKKFPQNSEVEAWLATQKDLFSEVVWCVVQPRGGGPKMNTYFIDHYDRYKEIYGRVDTEGLIYTILFKRLEVAKKTSDKGKMEEAIALCDLLEEHVPENKLSFRSMYYKETGDLKSYAAQIDQLASKYSKGYEYLLNDAAWTMYEESEEEWLLNKAIEWMGPVVQNKPNDFFYLDTYAALYFKTGQYQLASKWANEALHQGKAQGEDVSDTEKLIEKIKQAMKEK